MKKFFYQFKKLDNIKIYKYSENNNLEGRTFSPFIQKTLNINFCHDKITIGKKNSLRGMHGDFKTTKYLTCLSGNIYCNLFNINSDSKYYKKKYNFYLGEKNNICLLIPPKLLLGWIILSKEATVLYKFSYKGKYMDAKDQISFNYKDPQLKLKWPVLDSKIILSNRDKNTKSNYSLKK